MSFQFSRGGGGGDNEPYGMTMVLPFVGGEFREYVKMTPST